MIREFIIFGGVLIFLVAVMNGAVNWLKSQPAEVLGPKSNFEVVDNYRGCDLIRWSNSQLAEYKYVLYCPK